MGTGHPPVPIFPSLREKTNISQGNDPSGAKTILSVGAGSPRPSVTISEEPPIKGKMERTYPRAGFPPPILGAFETVRFRAGKPRPYGETCICLGYYATSLSNWPLSPQSRRLRRRASSAMHKFGQLRRRRRRASLTLDHNQGEP